MDHTKSNMLTIDLNRTYVAELENLVRENEVLRVQNETLKLQLKAKQSESEALREELKQLKTGSQKSEDGSVLCSVDEHCKVLNLEKSKYCAEMDKFRAALSRTKEKLEYVKSALCRERSQRIQADMEKQEVIEIAEELFEMRIATAEEGFSF